MLAQLAEQGAFNSEVQGSIPWRPTKRKRLMQEYEFNYSILAEDADDLLVDWEENETVFDYYFHKLVEEIWDGNEGKDQECAQY
jgi:hypothetical protein